MTMADMNDLLYDVYGAAVRGIVSLVFCVLAYACRLIVEFPVACIVAILVGWIGIRLLRGKGVCLLPPSAPNSPSDAGRRQLLPPPPEQQLLNLLAFYAASSSDLDLDTMNTNRLGEKEIRLRDMTEEELNNLSGDDAVAMRMSTRNAVDAATLRALNALGAWQGFVELRPRPCVHNIYALNLVSNRLSSSDRRQKGSVGGGVSPPQELSASADVLWETIQDMTECRERMPDNLAQLLLQQSGATCK